MITHRPNIPRENTQSAADAQIGAVTHHHDKEISPQSLETVAATDRATAMKAAAADNLKLNLIDNMLLKSYY